MSRLISDKYRAVQQEYLQRFNQLRANEEELNRIFIDIYGLQGELTPDVAEKDVTVYRIIDQPDAEQRKMPYVLSMRDEIVSLLSYMVGCMLGRYSPYVDGCCTPGANGAMTPSARALPRAPGRAIFTIPRWGCFCPITTALCP